MMLIEAFIDDVKLTVVMEYEVQYRDESKVLPNCGSFRKSRFQCKDSNRKFSDLVVLLMRHIDDRELDGSILADSYCETWNCIYKYFKINHVLVFFRRTHFQLQEQNL